MQDMQDKVAAFLTGLKKRKDITQYSEADTKQSIVQRLLSHLGWDVFSPEEVKQEYDVGKGRVDFALMLHSSPKVFIEVKRIDESLSDHEEQLVLYANSVSVKLATLTNGITWWLYLPLVEGKWEQKKFFTIDIREQEPNNAAEKFCQFLSRAMTASGESIARAEAVFKDRQKGSKIASALPIAWNKLIEGPDDMLVQLLKETAEKQCGYEITLEAVKKFVEQHQRDLSLSLTRRIDTENDKSRGDTSEEKKRDGTTPRRDETTLRVVINWQKVGKSRPPEVFENERGIRIFLRALERIAGHVGESKFQELLDFRVNRGMLLSRQPQPSKYYRKRVLQYYVLTYNATVEKAEILRNVVKRFNLPPDFLDVQVVELDR